MKNSKSIFLIGAGALNLLHALFHLIQFIQSVFLFVHSVNDEDNWVEHITHSPTFSIIWALIGLMTLIIGIRDYKHHKEHD